MNKYGFYFVSFISFFISAPLGASGAPGSHADHIADPIITIRYEPGYSRENPWGASIYQNGTVKQWVLNISQENGFPAPGKKVFSQYMIGVLETNKLWRILNQERFYSLKPYYSADCTLFPSGVNSFGFRVTDQPTLILTISTGRIQKQVTVYGAEFIAHSVTDESAPDYPYLNEVTRFFRTFMKVASAVPASHISQSQFNNFDRLYWTQPVTRHDLACATFQ